LSTVFDWFVGLCLYSHSASRGSKTLVKSLRQFYWKLLLHKTISTKASKMLDNSLQLVCRVLLALARLRQEGRRPLSIKVDFIYNFSKIAIGLNNGVVFRSSKTLKNNSARDRVQFNNCRRNQFPTIY